MSFGPNNGERKNVKMSEMIISLTDDGGGSGINTNTAISTPTNAHFKLSDMYGRAIYNDTDGNGSDTGYWTYRNGNEFVDLPTDGNNDVGRFKFAYGRYRTATGAPSNSTMQTSGTINMSNLTGISHNALTTDPCGQTRGVKGGYTSGTTTKPVLAYYQSGANLDTNTKSLKPGIFIDGTTAGPGNNASGLTTTLAQSANIGYSAYTTTHTNQWTHLGLNTKLCTGDRVIVVAHSAGGTMYTFSSYGPIYLRSGTGNGSAVSATVSTLQAPHKNETGTDDNLAVYSAVCTADGATMVGVNPFHSSAQPYIFHVFCIKGPNTTASVTNATTKYTQYETSTTVTTAPVFGFASNQKYYIGLSTSPFYANVQSNPYTFSSTTGEISGTQGFDTVFVLGNGGNSSDPGTGMVTLSNYTGGTQGTTTTDKYGYTYPVALEGKYTPEVGRRIPSKDGRFVQITGTRG